MSKIWQIFVPEAVHMHNKGEEAIIRGMADVVFPEKNAEFHILDLGIRKPYSLDSLHVYPFNWFYSVWRFQEFRLGITPREIYASFCSLLRHGLNRVYPGWYRIPQGPLRRTGRIMRELRSGRLPPRDEKTAAMKRILECDYLIAGHDGAFDEYDCHVMNMMHELGMRHGIFGSSMKPKVFSPVMISHFRRTLADSQFIYCRDQFAYEWAQSHFADLHPELAPDPAFGMLPAAPRRVDEIIAAESLGDFFTRPVVMLTTAEPAIIARNSFEKIPVRPGKLKRHHEVIAALAEHIVDKCGANVLFLPHTIGPTPDLDDRLVAKSVMARMPPRPNRVRLLETEYSARELKALVGRAEMLIAERIHSLIGAVGMNTPFMCLGVRQDNRVTMIAGEMCESQEKVHLLNDTDASRIVEHFDAVWKSRDKHRLRLERVSGGLQKRLREVGDKIRGEIERSTSTDM